MKASLQNAYALNIENVFKQLESSDQGIYSTEAADRLTKYGLNVLPNKRKFSIILLLIKQFQSWLILILIVAAIISILASHVTDSIVIVAIIIINAIIGFIQEYRAENAISSLQEMVVKTAKVLRDHQMVTINASQLVPGDIIILEEGDSIPADGRIFYSKNFRTLEAALTGESLPISKNENILLEDTGLADQRNMVWSGTFVAAGYAKAIITSTGGATAIGQISKTLTEINKDKPEFLKKTNLLAKQMSIIAIISALTLFIIGYYFSHLEIKEILLVSIAALVAAVPEGLPAIITIVLAIGARRMAKKGAIIREFNATETLGNVTTILTDKTGTLTLNSLTAEKVFIPENQSDILVSGEGWMPIGNFLQNGSIIDIAKYKGLQKVLEIATYSNNSDIKYSEEDESYQLIGDPTEGALNVLARKAGLRPEQFSTLKIDDWPFNSKVKLRATLTQKKTTYEVGIIGAPEQLLERTSFILKSNDIVPISEDDKLEINSKIEEWSNNAMRVIAVAYKEQSEKTLQENSIDKLIFVGLVGMIDPPRKEIKDAVAKCNKAGVRVIMVTGDHVNTAVAIAKITGIIDEGNEHQTAALTEQQLLKLNSNEFNQAVKNVSVFARLTPQMKLKIASTLQSQGHLIAMTGDGVNDAPALKRADIGISMGIMGTDVARENSEMVLADDNFATIVKAIEEGRIVFINARQTSFFLITTNVAESVTLIAALALGFPAPLIAIQILWLNLVTDSLPAIALANEKGQNDILENDTLQNRKHILNIEVLPLLIINVLTMTILSLLAFQYYFNQSLDLARTAVFVVMSSTQLFNVFNLRSIHKSVFSIGLFSNKYINIAFMVSLGFTIVISQVPFWAKIFRFEPLDWSHFAVLVAVSSIVLITGEIYKLAITRFQKMKR